jgi:predicted lipid-binding transport protein (Tim44 family)
MGRRPIVLFWGAVAAAVFFLGTAWTAAGRLGSGPHVLADGVVLAIAVAGFAATAFVAGRIAFVIGRAQRRARARRAARPGGAAHAQQPVETAYVVAIGSSQARSPRSPEGHTNV